MPILAQSDRSANVASSKDILEKKRKSLGKKESGLLWKSDDVVLDNRICAMGRFTRTMRRVESNMALTTIVTKVRDFLFPSGYAQKLTEKKLASLLAGRGSCPGNPSVIHTKTSGEWYLMDPLNFMTASPSRIATLSTKCCSKKSEFLQLHRCFSLHLRGSCRLQRRREKLLYQMMVRKKDGYIYLFP